MKNKDKIDLRREKLRKLLGQEMEEYQYEAYSNNCPESLLIKFNSFNNYNSKINKKEEEKNIYLNNGKSNNNININTLQNKNRNNNYYNMNNATENKNINNLNQNNGQNYDIKNNQIRNKEQENNYIYNNGANNQNNININRMNNNESYKYGNIDIDSEINNYSDYYNKLKIDEFMSKKRIQDDLLNQINQKLDKINKNINDKTYQENLAFQYFQNKKQINNDNKQ